MRQILTKAIRSIARDLSVDLRRYNLHTSYELQLVAQLRQHGVDLVLDVGANDGGFAGDLRAARYGGRILSFEPLSSARSVLVKKARSDDQWAIAPQMALGEVDGEVEIHVAGNSTSSSILNMLERHETSAPESRYVGTERVPLRRLDGFSHSYMTEARAPFLKVDTQGYEVQVLSGAARYLQRLRGVQLELSLVPLYEGQELYRDIISRMDALGFDLWSIRPGFLDPESGRLLQFDGAFFRRTA